MDLRITIFLSLFFFVSVSVQGQSAFDKMTNEKMRKILHRETENLEGDSGRWKTEYNGRIIYIVTDNNFNRMRIICPIITVKEIKKEEYKILLEANFDKALDAKYSIYDEALWSTYTHPLAELSVEQFKDAMRQVVKLASNYGTSYASTDFVFGGGDN